MKIKDCMENNVWYLKPENTIQECAKLMSEKHIGCVPVCDDSNSIVGLVTDRDVILRCIACDKDCKTTKISEIMTTDICYCNSDVEIEEAKKIMSDNQIRRVPVVNNENKIVGIITLGDLAKNNNTSSSDVLEDICKCNEKNAE